MGLLSLLTEPIRRLLNTDSLGVVLSTVILSFILFAIVINALRQLLFKNPSEPPLVFHWVPFIGSTIEYGIDPYRFFFRCREKVSGLLDCQHITF